MEAPTRRSEKQQFSSRVLFFNNLKETEPLRIASFIEMVEAQLDQVD